uniref:Carboxymuconolactone decarboxylase family protein n=1 Tax=Streptomyces sp. NBC_00119 TaxID=2975659 RepID=A0AAU1TY49_9ACTN
MTTSSRPDAGAPAAVSEPEPAPPAPDEILGAKLAALIRLKLDVSVTHLYSRGVRRHMRAALRAGATRDEVLAVVKLSTVIGIHALAVGMPILNQELAYARMPAEPAISARPTPVCDALRRDGNFNPDWEAIHEAAPDWLEGFLATGLGIWRDGVLPPLWIELLCIAGDAALTHMYTPGTRRHIRAALALGAEREQIRAVLEIVGRQSRDAYEASLPVLDDVCAL